MVKPQKYDSLTDVDKANVVKKKYDKLNPTDQYTTSRDYNLRELEIDFTINSIKQYVKPRPRILDIGCGNGYTGIRISKEMMCSITGLDFSENMIKGANKLRDDSFESLKGNITFKVNDILYSDWSIKWPDVYDVILTERLLLNLPSKEKQYVVINKIHRMLKHGGLYIMIEGTKEGLAALNEIRVIAGLKEIPDRDKSNFSSLKFDEKELNIKLTNKFHIIQEKYWGIYYLMSRVIYPLTIYPKEPQFDNKINFLAKTIQNSNINDTSRIGHVRGLLLQKI